MTRKKPRMLFRGLRAMIWHDCDPNRQFLELYLQRLGLRVSCSSAGGKLGEGSEFNLLFFDSDQDLPIGELNHDVPMIALVGSEAPSRLQWILGHNAASLIFKPVRSAGIYGSIVFAMNQHEERLSIAAQQERLNSKIRYRKLVIFAVLKLMREQGCDEEQAFSGLRRQAMERRITIEMLCADVLAQNLPAGRLQNPWPLAHERP